MNRVIRDLAFCCIIMHKVAQCRKIMINKVPYIMPDLELNNPFVRRKLLTARLKKGATLVASQLAGEFEVSLDTIRRDLLALEEQGLACRIRGGAMPVRQPPAPFAQRMATERNPALELMARAALGLIEDGMSIILDGGTSVQKIAEFLPAMPHSLIITPSPVIAQTTLSKAIPTFMIGGRLSGLGGVAVGREAEEQLANRAADIAFLGVCGLDPDFGFSADDDEEACLKRTMIQASNRACLMAAEAKIGTRARHKVTSCQSIDVIISDCANSSMKPFEEEGVDIIHV